MLDTDGSAVQVRTGVLHADGEWLRRADLAHYDATHHNMALPTDLTGEAGPPSAPRRRPGLPRRYDN